MAKSKNQNSMFEGLDQRNIDLIEQSNQLNEKLSRLANHLEQKQSHLTPRLVNKNRLLKKYKIRILKRKKEQEAREREIEKNFEMFREKKMKPRSILKSSLKAKKLNFSIIDERPEISKKRAKKNWKKLRLMKNALFAILGKYKKSRRELEEKKISLKHLFKKKFPDAIEKFSLLFENLGRDSLRSIWMDGNANVIVFDAEIRKEYMLKESKEYHRSFNFFCQREVDVIHVQSNFRNILYLFKKNLIFFNF